MSNSLSRRPFARAVAVVCTVAAGLLAALVVALPPAAAAAPSDSQLAGSVVTLINKARVQHGLGSLSVDSRLVIRATSHSALVAATGTLSNTVGGEASPWTRLYQLGYLPAAATQVIGVSSRAEWLTNQVGAMLKDSRRAALLSTSYRNVGVAVRYVAKRHCYVVTVVYARQRALTTAESYALRVFDTLNAERHAHGLAPLALDSRLITSAHRHNVAMAKPNILAHQVPGEPDLAARIRAAGYRYSWAGENVAWTTARTAAGLVDVHTAMYTERPPYDQHRQNMLSRTYSQVGIDVYFDAAHGKAWLTEDFGRPQ